MAMARLSAASNRTSSRMIRRWWAPWKRRSINKLLLLGLALCPACPGYSVLTHEAIIDAAWKDDIQPLLLKRFPQATGEELRKAHAYAYGGAIIQDIGYYPF